MGSIFSQIVLLLLIFFVAHFYFYLSMFKLSLMSGSPVICVFESTEIRIL